MVGVWFFLRQILLQSSLSSLSRECQSRSLMPVLQYCKGTSTHDGYDDVKYNNLFYCTNNKKFSLPSYLVTALCIPRHNSFLSLTPQHNLEADGDLCCESTVDPSVLQNSNTCLFAAHVEVSNGMTASLFHLTNSVQSSINEANVHRDRVRERCQQWADVVSVRWIFQFEYQNGMQREKVKMLYKESVERIHAILETIDSYQFRGIIIGLEEQVSDTEQA